jgi:hypothetical protein
MGLNIYINYYISILIYVSKMQAVRFELTKQIAQDLKSCPFDRSGTLAFDTIWSLSIWGLEPQALRLEALRAIHCAIQTVLY